MVAESDVTQVSKKVSDGIIALLIESRIDYFTARNKKSHNILSEMKIQNNKPQPTISINRPLFLGRSRSRSSVPRKSRHSKSQMSAEAAFLLAS